jgi:hypothetical protein
MPIIPVLGIISCVFMIVNLSFDVLALGIILLIIGIILYKAMIKYKRDAMFGKEF